MNQINEAGAIGLPATPYRGRFAPTPSGPLHLGSLLTALASFLQARKAGGSWLLRIDDLDAQRSRREHADTILRQLEAHGLHWDEPVRWQSQHVEAYEGTFRDLQNRAALYVCTCTRAKLAADSRPGPDGPVYGGACHGHHRVDDHGSVRLSIGTGRLRILDPWQGPIERDRQTEIGDFVLRRADGQIGYQLACVVDESAQRITEVVRGADLIGSSLRQLHLHDLLRWPTPAYRHLPILLDEQHRKLSKQNHATPLTSRAAAPNIYCCLSLLGQQPPKALAEGSLEQALSWAIGHWQTDAIPKVLTLSAPN